MISIKKKRNDVYTYASILQIMPGFPNDGIEKTEVMYGTENTTKVILEFLSRANKNLDIYADNTWPFVSMGNGVFKRAIQDIKKRGV